MELLPPQSKPRMSNSVARKAIPMGIAAMRRRNPKSRCTKREGSGRKKADHMEKAKPTRESPSRKRPAVFSGFVTISPAA
jgi:hypothetical protein